MQAWDTVVKNHAAAATATGLPQMEPFRRDARFQSIVARLRFADYWELHGAPDAAELRGGALIDSELTSKAGRDAGVRSAKA